MQLYKHISNLHEGRHKGKSDDSLMKVMSSEMTINLDVFGVFTKDRVASDLCDIHIITNTIHRNWYRKTLIESSSPRN